MKASIKNFMSSSSSSQIGQSGYNNIQTSRILSASTSSNSFPQKNEVKPFTLSGEYNYFVEVEVNGQKWNQSCNVGINVFTDSHQKIAIAAKFKWFRILGEERYYSLYEVAGNTYQCCAQDLQSYIKCEVHPIDAAEEQCKGVATIIFGPIDLETNVRETLANIVSTGGTKFPSQVLVNEQVGKQRKSVRAEFFLNQESMRLVVGDQSLKFRHSLDFPDLKMNYLDVQKLQITFDNKNSDVTQQLYSLLKQIDSLPTSATSERITLALQMETRTQRDLLYLAQKAFATKNYLIDSRIIRNLEISLEQWGEQSNIPLSDVLLMVEGMKKELDNMINLNKGLLADKEKQKREILKLEEEIKDTIEIYTKMIEQIKEAQEDKFGVNYSNILDQSIQHAYSLRDDLGIKQKLKNYAAERDKMELIIKNLEEENEVLKATANRDSNARDTWAQREGGTAELKKQVRELENMLREVKLNESFSEGRIFEQKFFNEQTKNYQLQNEIEKLKQEKISQKSSGGMLMTSENNRYNPVGINHLQQTKKPFGLPILLSNNENEIDRLNQEINNYKLQLEIAQADIIKLQNTNTFGITGQTNAINNYFPQKNFQSNMSNGYYSNNNNYQSNLQEEQLNMKLIEKDKELIASEFKQEELRREGQRLKEQISQLEQKINQNLFKNQDTLFFNQSSLQSEDARIMGISPEDRKMSKEKEINQYKSRIDSLERKLQKQQNLAHWKYIQKGVGYSFIEDSSNLKSENAFLKGKVESLQKELNSKTNAQQQQAEFIQLLETNKKIMIENAEISQLNKKLIDEIDLLRNTSKSRFDEISQVVEKGKDVEELQRKLEKQTKLNVALTKKMKEMKSKHEQVLDLHNESISSILNSSNAGDKAQLQTLLSTNQRIIEENVKLTIQNKKLEEELDGLKNSGSQSMIAVNDKSRIEKEIKQIKEKMDEKQRENDILQFQLKIEREKIKSTNADDSMEFVLKGIHNDHQFHHQNNTDYVSIQQFKSLMDTNNKLMEEISKLTEANRKLNEEVEFNKSLSRSHLDISGVHQQEGLQKQLDIQNKNNVLLVQQMNELKQFYENAYRENKSDKQSVFDPKQTSSLQLQSLIDTNKKLMEEVISLTEANRKLNEERSISRSFDISGIEEKTRQVNRLQSQLDQQNKANFELLLQMKEMKSTYEQTQSQKANANMYGIQYNSYNIKPEAMEFKQSQEFNQLKETNKKLMEEVIQLTEANRILNEERSMSRSLDISGIYEKAGQVDRLQQQLDQQNKANFELQIQMREMQQTYEQTQSKLNNAPNLFGISYNSFIKPEVIEFKQSQEFNQLMQTNKKLMEEVSSLTEANRKLNEEIQVQKNISNLSKSHFDISGVIEQKGQQSADQFDKQIEEQGKANALILQRMQDIKENYSKSRIEKKNSMESKYKQEFKSLMETNKKLMEEITTLTEANRKLNEENEFHRSMSRSHLDNSFNMERVAEVEKLLIESKGNNQALVSQINSMKFQQEKEIQDVSSQSNNLAAQLKKLEDQNRKLEDQVAKQKGKINELELKQVDENVQAAQQMNLESKERVNIQLKADFKESEERNMEYSNNIRQQQIKLMDYEFKQREYENKIQDATKLIQKHEKEINKLQKDISAKEGAQMLVEDLQQRVKERDQTQREVQEMNLRQIQEKEQELKQKEQFIKQLQNQQETDQNQIEEDKKLSQRMTQQIMALSQQNQLLMAQTEEFRQNMNNNSSFISKSYISNSERDRERERMDQLQAENRILAEELVAMSKRQREQIMNQLEQPEQQQQQQYDPQNIKEQFSITEQIKIEELQEQIERLLQVNQRLLIENQEKGKQCADLKEQISELNLSKGSISFCFDNHNQNNNINNSFINHSFIINTNMASNNNNILAQQNNNNHNKWSILESMQEQDAKSTSINQLMKQLEVEKEELVSRHEKTIQKLKENQEREKEETQRKNERIIKDIQVESEKQRMKNLEEIQKYDHKQNEQQTTIKSFQKENALLKAEILQIQSQSRAEQQEKSKKQKNELKIFQEEKLQLESQKSLMKNQKEALELKNTSLIGQLKEKEERIEKSIQDINVLKNTLRQQETNCKKLEASQKIVEGLNKELRSEVEEKFSKIEGQCSIIKKLEGNIRDWNNQLKLKEETIQMYENQIQEIKKKWEQRMIEEAALSKEEISKIKRENSSLKAEIQKDREIFNSDKVNFIEEKKKLSDQIVKLNAQVAKLNEEKHLEIKQLIEKNERLADINATEAKIKEELHQRMEDISEDAKQEISDLIKKWEQTRKEDNQRSQGEMNILNEEINKIKQESKKDIEERDEQITQQKDEIKAKTKLIISHKEEIFNMSKEISKINLDFTKKGSELVSITKQLQETNSKLEEKSKEQVILNKQLEEKEKQLKEEKEMKDKQQKQNEDDLEILRKDIIQKALKFQQELAESDQKLIFAETISEEEKDNFEQEKQKLEEIIDALKQEKEEIQNENDKISNQNRDLLKEKNYLNKQIKELRERIESLQKDKSELESQIQTQQENMDHIGREQEESKSQFDEEIFHAKKEIYSLKNQNQNYIDTLFEYKNIEIKLLQEIDSLKESNSLVTDSNSQAQNSIIELKDNIMKQEKLATEMKDKDIESQRKITTLKETVEIFTKSNQAAENINKELQIQIAKQNDQIIILTQQNQKYEDQIANLTTKLQSFLDAKVSNEKSTKDVQMTNQNEENKNINFEKTLDSSKEKNLNESFSIEGECSQCKDVQQNLKSSKEQIDTLSSELTTKLQIIQNLTTQNNNLVAQTFELSDQLQKIQEEIELNNSSCSHNSSVGEQVD